MDFVQGAEGVMPVKMHLENNSKIAFKDISDELTKHRIEAAESVKNRIRNRAEAQHTTPKAKITGNLAKGAYARHEEGVSFVGIRRPGYHNFLVEFGHFAGKTHLATKAGHGNIKRESLLTARKFVPPHPVVEPAFEESAAEVERIMSQEVKL